MIGYIATKSFILLLRSKIRSGKVYVSCKSKYRVIFIVNSLRKKLLKYAKSKHIKEGAIFISRNGRPIDRISIWREMKKLCQAQR